MSEHTPQTKHDYVLYVVGLAGAAISPYVKMIIERVGLSRDPGLKMAADTLADDRIEKARLLALVEKREARIERLTSQLVHAGLLPVD